MLQTWKAWARSLKENIFALYLAAHDPRVPASAKILAILVVAYALSPVDLIPDFIPVLGYLDDLILLPLGVAVAIRLIPDAIWAECCRAARQEGGRRLPSSRTAAAVIVSLWVLILALIGAIVWR